MGLFGEVAAISKEYIARISYGKDSLKMLEVIHSRGLPLDRITTTDVWATDTISANLPPMEEFKARMDERIWQLYRIEVEHLCARNKDGSKRTYEKMFYYVPVRRSQNVQVERESWIGPGSIQGFPVLGIPWCQSTLKRSARLPSTGQHQGISLYCWEQMVPEAQERLGPGYKDFPPKSLLGAEKSKSTRSKPRFSNEPATTGKNRNIVEYLGIAADEPKRFGQLNDRKRAPLVEFDIDEDLCGLYCQYNDMLSPSYETSCRDGCWFCHNQGVNKLRLLRRNWPDHWALLMKWDLDSPSTFKSDGHTVHDFDRRFQMEDERMIPTDRSFRWEMLEKPPKFRPWDYDQLSLFE